MKRRTVWFGMAVVFSMAVVALGADSAAPQWEVHDMTRPEPKVVVPGAEPGAPPSDAIVLFDGKALSQWVDGKGAEPKWKVENGYAEIVKDGGTIQTKQSFGDCQLHVEWCAPPKDGEGGQHPGNSGVFLMNQYEIQVLDSFENETYADGQAGSLYGQYPPLVNACRAPGEWQTFDIVFHRPIFAADGTVERPARATLLYNGVLVQDNVDLMGRTAHKQRAKYAPHADRLPIGLQDHGQAVRFRNIWVRELPEKE